jgi:hypothetical protein
LAPTPPAGYNSYYRRIFSLRTSATGALLLGVAIEGPGGSYWFLLATHLTDYTGSPVSGAARTTVALTVPDGIKTQPLVKPYAAATASAYGAWLSSLDEPDDSAYLADSQTANSVTSVGGIVTPFITTDLNRQIAIRAAGGGSGSAGIINRGWIDFRR